MVVAVQALAGGNDMKHNQGHSGPKALSTLSPSTTLFQSTI